MMKTFEESLLNNAKIFFCCLSKRNLNMNVYRINVLWCRNIWITFEVRILKLLQYEPSTELHTRYEH